MKRASALLCLILMVMSGIAQDIHFSQYRTTPILVNPAQAGFIFAKARFAANHRSQWRSVTVPFNTFSFSGDFKLYQDKRARNIIGMAVAAYHDKAGDSQFGTSSAMAGFSYIVALNDYHNHFLSVGGSGSYNDRSYDYTLLVFGNQFNGDRFDPDRYNGETFLNRGFRFFDYNLGVHWYYRPDQDVAYDAGLVVSHLTRPSQSMLENSDVRLDRKFTFYINAEILQPNKQTIIPGFYLSRQGTYTEIIGGTMISLERFTGGRTLSNLQAGLFIRPVDAAILIFNFDYQHITFGISYDVNYSGLRSASTFRGGFELSALYMVQKKKKKKPTSIKCPDPF